MDKEFKVYFTHMARDTKGKPWVCQCHFAKDLEEVQLQVRMGGYGYPAYKGHFLAIESETA